MIFDGHGTTGARSTWARGTGDAPGSSATASMPSSNTAVTSGASSSTTSSPSRRAARVPPTVRIVTKRMLTSWARQVSNLRATDYESAALPLSYGPVRRLASVVDCGVLIGRRGFGGARARLGRPRVDDDDGRSGRDLAEQVDLVAAAHAYAAVRCAGADGTD